MFFFLFSCMPMPVAPVHHALVCSDHCDPTQVQDHFQRWSNEALHAPGSTFQVWSQGSRQVHVCTPQTWGAGVAARQAAFVQDVQAHLATTEPWTAPNCAGVLPMGAEQMAWVATDGRLEAAVPQLRQEGVICDRSSSMGTSACTSELLDQLYHDWLLGADVGSTLVVVGVSRRREDATLQTFVATEAGLAARLAHGLSQVTWDFSGVPGSAIVEALELATGALGGRLGVHRYTIMSDLRQYTPSVWDFEQSIPSVTAFGHWLAREHLQPAVQGAEVRVCGLHHRTGPDAAQFSAARASALTDLWQDIFQQSHPNSLTFLPECSHLSEAI